ncbi:MAG: 4'-phosphopantetheinyl transferase superfamily protein [Flavobacteriaceae bacterium]|nr:4'-phosphopantetheinyl transferase superfamily protein [Flavobacteriaceae bacterium]
MPLYKTLRPNSQTIVKIWWITESFEELREELELLPDTLERAEGMKSELHQKGFLSVRRLLKEFGYTDSDLYYDENGKPHLRDGKYISISHSYIYSAIIVGEQPVGIDIEKQRQKIKLISSKFCGPERKFFNPESEKYIRQLTVIWCIKESLYKLYAKPGLSFKENTLVIPAMLEDGETDAWILYGTDRKKYKFNFLEFDGFTCAFTVS